MAVAGTLAPGAPTASSGPVGEWYKVRVESYKYPLSIEADLERALRAKGWNVEKIAYSWLRVPFVSKHAWDVYVRQDGKGFNDAVKDATDAFEAVVNKSKTTGDYVAQTGTTIRFAAIAIVAVAAIYILSTSRKLLA